MIAVEQVLLPTPKGRDAWLDIMRFGAILLVLGSHLRDLPAGMKPLLSEIVCAWKRGGWVGVDLFFVLSGYLVSGLLFAEIKKNGRADVPRFLIRRGFKIYPSFYVAVLFTIAWRLIFLDSSISTSRLMGEVFFLQNYVGMYWQHHWSLAVEEHFYLLLAMGVGVTQLLRRPPISLDTFRFLPWAWALAACICLFLRLHISLDAPFEPRTHLIPTHLRIDSLMAGALLGWLMHHRLPLSRPCRKTRLLLLCAGAALFIPPFIWDFTQVWWVLPFGALFHSAGAAMIILAGISRQRRESMPEKCLAWIGARSYNIYLWHMPWLIWLNPPLCRLLGIQDSWISCATLYIAGSFALGICMTAAIERPFLNIRERLFPHQAKQQPATLWQK